MENVPPPLLINTGIAGLVVAWFMWRVEKKLDRFTDATYDVAIQQARLQTLMPGVPEHVVAKAEESIKDIEKKKNGG